ncbi:MAG TPA: hypothetical protein VG871_18435 [Vicinamibacterales bacterium]|nr:hypothetical protein [Vicinamibacterales bacterium]
MKKEVFAVVSMAMVLAYAMPKASTTRVVGVLADVERHSPPTLQLTSKGSDSKTVHTDEKTAYMKWVTHKPWQGGERIDSSALVQGRCVEVELSDGNVAKVVRVSDEPAGSVFDPCRGRR